MTAACLISEETTQLFPRVAEPFYIPTNNVWVIQLLCILPSICENIIILKITPG